MTGVRKLSIFRQIQARSVTGHMAFPEMIRNDQARELIIQFNDVNKSKKIREDRCDQLERLAMQGNKIARSFFNNLFKKDRTFEASALYPYAYECLEDIAWALKDAELLYRVYLVNFRLVESSEYIRRNIATGFRYLEAAAQARGKYATLAAFTLAGMYSATLGYPITYPSGIYSREFFDSRTDVGGSGRGSLQSLAELYGLSTDGKIHGNTYQDANEIMFFKLGCEQAIHNLLTRYEGNLAKEMNARLSNLNAFLKQQYAIYYKLALRNTLKYGCRTGGIMIDQLIEHAPFLVYDSGDNTMLPELLRDFREKLIKEAESGNIHACALVADLPNLELNKKLYWLNEILVHGSPGDEVVVNAAGRIENIYSVTILGGAPREFLIRAANAGYSQAAYRLADIASLASGAHLSSGEEDRAREWYREFIHYFKLALKFGKETMDVTHIVQLCAAAHGKYPDADCLEILAQGIKYGSSQSLAEMLRLAGLLQNAELLKAWKEIQSLDCQSFTSVIKINLLTQQTIDAFKNVRPDSNYRLLF